MLRALITSKVRRKLLVLFLTNPMTEFYVREITRKTCEEINAIRLELKRLEDAGIVTSRKSANLKYFSVNTKCPIYEELKRIILKTEGIGNLLNEALSSVEDIELAFVYGSFAKKEEKARSDIDLMIIGKISPQKLNRVIRKLENEIGREINYTIYPKQELLKRKKEGFIQNVLKTEKIMLVGVEDELKRLVK